MYTVPYPATYFTWPHLSGSETGPYPKTYSRAKECNEGAREVRLQKGPRGWGLKDSTYSPKWTEKIGFVKKKILVEIFDCKVQKSGVHVVNDYADTGFFIDFSLDTEIYIFLNSCY